MKIDGKDIGDWGLKVMSYEGLLNLPPRIEPSFYDWGDLIEPLTDAEDIHFHPNTFSMAMFYEKNQEFLKGPLKKYRVQSRGGYAMAPFNGWSDLLDGEGNLVLGSDRGYNIFTMEEGNWQRKSYGLSHNTKGPEDMAEYIKSLPKGKSLIITTFGDPLSHRLTAGLPEAIYDCGGSKEIFGNPNFKSYSSYVLIGKKGIGERNADEYYRGEIDKDPNAWIDIGFYMQGDEIILNKANPSLEDLIEHLYILCASELRIEAPYKNTRAKLKQIKKKESFQGGRAGRFILEFEEQRQPSYDYPQGLLKIDQGGLSIDHYHVEENFSLILEDFKEHRAALKDSPAAIYQKEELSALKGQVRIHLKLSGRYPSLGVMVEKIEQFKAFFASAGTRVIAYKGYEYYSYLTSGIQIKTPREDLAEVVLTLNVRDKMKSWDANL